MQRSRLIDEEAAAWVVRAEGTAMTEAERQAMNRWMRRSAAHAEALTRARASWIALAHLRPGTGVARPTRRSARTAGRRPLAKAAAALLLAAGVAGLTGLGGDVADHRTGRGEVRRITLADGSQLVLAGESAVAVRFDATARRVDLLAGEVLFAPAPIGPAEVRPFLVFAGGGRIRALGTRFTVCQRIDGFDVAVLEHGVELRLAQAESRTSVVLRQSQALHFDGDTIGVPFRVDVAHLASWTSGRLLFDRMSLADVVAVLNRYRPGRIILAGPGLGVRRVSGVFQADRPDDALRAILTEIGARRIDLPFGTVLLL